MVKAFILLFNYLYLIININITEFNKKSENAKANENKFLQYNLVRKNK